MLGEATYDPQQCSWTVFVRIDLPIAKEASFTVAALELLIVELLLVFHHVPEGVVGVSCLSKFTLAHAARMEKVVAAVTFDQPRIISRDKTVAVLA